MRTLAVFSVFSLYMLEFAFYFIDWTKNPEYFTVLSFCKKNDENHVSYKPLMFSKLLRTFS